MRGKGCLASSSAPPPGITPAYAGKSCCQWWTGKHARDHPRVCGEKLFFLESERVVRGSPPRMRGKGSDCVLLVAHIGITPAYAGKSEMDKIAAVSKEGSPPRMRGKESCITILLSAFGITPAYAGKRCFPKRLSARLGDHPRVCGEKT